jgi:cytosine/adenosine deaminase-related metal-dependent hydrolase
LLSRKSIPQMRRLRGNHAHLGFEAIPNSQFPLGKASGPERLTMDSSASSIWLVGGMLAVDSETAIQASLEISEGRIRRVLTGDGAPDASSEVATIHLEDHLILPGLINAHDHLEFNLFPRLGRGPYSNSADWARDIYQPELSPLREHLSVPKKVRLWWGGLKNLVSGVTTVCHHNPYDNVFEEGFPVHVVRRYGWAHSMTFERNVFHAFAATESDSPFIIHAGEGTDEQSGNEVFELERIGVLSPRTILVHGVAFSESGHALRQRRGAALIWCPTSNRFLFGKTLNARDCDGRVALGSDSALTGQGSLLDEIRAARENGAAPNAIYSMVTDAAASILRLKEGEGMLKPGSIANLTAIPWSSVTPADALAQLDVQQIRLVLISGQLHLAADEMMARCHGLHREDLEAIEIDGVRRWVRAPVHWLLSETSTHLGNEIRLAGMRISA